jgi:hypothetical protein
MTHPITPPPELALQWINEYLNEHPEGLNVEVLVVSAAQWGADQELEACCKWLAARDLRSQSVAPCLLRIARRPKPPSLKEQALEALDRMDQLPTAEDQRTIRRALEALPE